ncbi:dTMP kinase [bacterium]|nr:dTMP kinase [Rubripirellula sp.]MDB4353282.1 dTMP kinase [bacterium]MDB4477481.1 dTMP kinase [Rhodopirellula sp.]MDB4621980.1 dTMP kinase [Rubripirellula sp.]MDB4644451.1 dTMP kinase [Rubripirellula sp.]
MFITLDGIDGVGKSTQIERLINYLGERGQETLLVRDPGTTEIGSKLREILLESDLELHRRTEAMLFMASRCEMVETILRPAIAEGKTVVSDRFLLANVVYQSVGGEVLPDLLWQMGRLANGGLTPDLTILLDMPAQRSMERIGSETDRMESRGVDYMEAVRQAFLQQLPHSSQATAIINADQTPEEVSHDLLTSVEQILA